MHKIDGTGATVDNLFTEGDPGSGEVPTKITDDWLNAVQTELVNVITGTGATLNKANNTQVKTAIQAMIDSLVISRYQSFVVDPTDGDYTATGGDDGTKFNSLEAALAYTQPGRTDILVQNGNVTWDFNTTNFYLTSRHITIRGDSKTREVVRTHNASADSRVVVENGSLVFQKITFKYGDATTEPIIAGLDGVVSFTSIDGAATGGCIVEPTNGCTKSLVFMDCFAKFISLFCTYQNGNSQNILANLSAVQYALHYAEGAAPNSYSGFNTLASQATAGWH